MIELVHSGKEYSFGEMEEAMEFGASLDGFDVWIDGGLFMVCLKNHFTGEFESEVFH